MLRQKKTEGFQSSTHKDLSVDFWELMAHALEMGLTKSEFEHMRMGEFLDLFDSFKPIHNAHINKNLYPLPEKQVSMRDL